MTGAEADIALAETSPARRRLSETERRGTILQSAEEVFLAQGYAAANMDDVARGARMSKKTLYQIFPSKAALFEAVVAHQLSPLHESSPDESGEDPRASLVALLERAAVTILDPKQVSLFRLLAAESRRSPELAQAFHRTGPGRGQDAIQRCIAYHAQAGRIRITDPLEAAGMLYGMAVGKAHVLLMLGLREQPSAAEVSGLVNRAVDLFLRGSRPD
ncbi:TetR/AcrR family transcriptional regulator C-terminal domain-containing protein [Roseococcus sp. YIM B11640]|uniref:TetR/AcrR family transcriptional regulator C-terminal domain-containing protein n=1 Tax=Roseococcus sp. YIM B11640 TaxID=3133973 RepID=UPI003C7D9F54